MAKLLTDLRNSLWFLPALIVLSSGGLAVGAVELDAFVGEDALSRFPRLFGTRAEGARQLLSAIASSTITVTGVVFSITIVALSLTAAQYSPRVLRNFMADRANQLVLGVFLGVYVYCLLVLRTVRGGEDAFVPGISILVALLLALIGIGFLIFFIHHVAVSIQVSQIATRISRDTIAAIRTMYPQKLEAYAAAAAGDNAALEWRAVASRATGYIQQIDFARLAGAAREAHRVVRMEKVVGEFVIEGHPLLAVSGPEDPQTPFLQALHSAYAINSYRDVSQDPAFGLQQLVDIAQRALSPGVNDIGTARNLLHHISAVLCELATRAVPEEQYVFCEGELALVRRGITFEQHVELALAPIRRDAIGKPEMLMQLLDALAVLGRSTSEPGRRSVVTQQVGAIEEAVKREELTSGDRLRISESIRDTLRPASSIETTAFAARVACTKKGPA